ncbi:MAG TPA: DEAD/DEAH box helicase family protein [Kofleriaceae bacterium]|nr:DEAD/DEAH box helicase family protein [Kofleriaceae bacterium]
MSVFLEVPEGAWVAANELAFAFRDRHPVSPGHTLVVTRRVVADWFAASEEERAALMSLVEEVKRGLDQELRPDGYNVGFNAGAAAGQTVMHLHVHVIPRFRGDMDDPRGGVRHVIPSKGNYLHRSEPLATGGEKDPFARHVLPLFERAKEIAIVAAFVQESGLERIRAATRAALQRGARIRIITGDYLDITQASALEILLDWQRGAEPEESDDLEVEGGLGAEGGPEAEESLGEQGKLEAAIIEVERLPPGGRSFHPKAWRFEAKTFGIAFVGSSNLSRTALEAGIEWNLRVDRDRDMAAYQRISQAFDELWARARPLDAAWIAEYAQRARRQPVMLPPGEVEPELLEPPPAPHEAQKKALEALRRGRQQGRRRAIVVFATGLGKTWLAAFDYAQLREELGRRPRLLFLAHRQELLVQAARTYRRQLRQMKEQARVGWFVGAEGELSADLVLASVPKLARAEHVRALVQQAFDYVVIDEVHHAAADSYRKIIDRIDPRFLLGLTATPDRADAADILGLFDDFVAYRADIPQGIALGRLTPFHYFGVRDDIDYANIPWRNRQFEPRALAAAAQTEARMQTLWRAWSAHPARRSLVFCCSIAHAGYVRAWLRARGVRVAAVYAGEGSDDREQSLARLAAGELDAVCAVDVFNEGVDVPSIDRVVMLRPTESGTVFMQQLGRGLRAAAGKAAVTVIDFVGNHRVFLERLRTLLSLGGAGSPAELRRFLGAAGSEALPEGCSVEVELEAKELLARLFRVGGADEVERAYRELCVERGADADRGLRPTAGELQRMGYLPGRLRERHGSWLEFVRGEHGLTVEEARVLEQAGDFLREIEVTEMTKCFKMVTLEALLEQGALTAGMPLRELAIRAHAILRRSPELFADVTDEELRRETLEGQALGAWIAYWRKNPIAAWIGDKRERRTWFRLDGDRLVLELQIEEQHEAALAKLTRELVDWRLAQYRARKRERAPSAEGFVCRVISNQRDPILKLPDRARAAIPEGEADVRLPDGSIWQFRFVKEYCNVARQAGTARNGLPDLLRGWFGPRVGQPGTAFQVRFHAGPDGLWVEPERAAVIELASRRKVVAYPDLRAAAGHAQGAAAPPDDELVWLPLEDASPELFAVRVSGTSMDGGKEPLRDGDWAVMRVARSMPASAVEGRVVLVETSDDSFGARYQIKRLRRSGAGWLLASDNPAGPTIEATEEMVPIARLERAIRPESFAPTEGTVLEEHGLAAGFGLEAVAPRSDRYGGHLFVFVDRKGMLDAPDRLRFLGVTPRAAETAYVLIARQGAWRYAGVARQTGQRGVWSLPEVDFASWREWGEGRETSRRIPDEAMARAQAAVEAVLSRPEAERWLERGDGGRARVIGRAPRGGLRIDGGEGGFAERTVSVLDLAWVIVADGDVEEHGGLLDEERVNRLRYLEGTPKGSTWWIDTGWAIAAWKLVRGAGRAPGPSLGGPG